MREAVVKKPYYHLFVRHRSAFSPSRYIYVGTFESLQEALELAREEEEALEPAWNAEQNQHFEHYQVVFQGRVRPGREVLITRYVSDGELCECDFCHALVPDTQLYGYEGGWVCTGCIDAFDLPQCERCGTYLHYRSSQCRICGKRR